MRVCLWWSCARACVCGGYVRVCLCVNDWCNVLWFIDCSERDALHTHSLFSAVFGVTAAADFNGDGFLDIVTVSDLDGAQQE